MTRSQMSATSSQRGFNNLNKRHGSMEFKRQGSMDLLWKPVKQSGNFDLTL